MYIQHGKAHTRLYRLWAGMKARCTNPNRPKAHLYVEAGISYCTEWEEFPAFHEWATTNGYAEGLTLDRINGTKGYSPDNCRWVSNTIQARNLKPIVKSSKYYGVYWDKTRNKWKAGISINNKHKFIGRYPTELEAARARDSFVVDNGLEGFNLNKDTYTEV